MIPIRITYIRGTFTSRGAEDYLSILYSNGTEETRYCHVPDINQNYFHFIR